MDGSSLGLDVRDYAAVKRRMAEAAERLGGLDHVVCTAGVLRIGTLGRYAGRRDGRGHRGQPQRHAQLAARPTRDFRVHTWLATVFASSSFTRGDPTTSPTPRASRPFVNMTQRLERKEWRDEGYPRERGQPGTDRHADAAPGIPGRIARRDAGGPTTSRGPRSASSGPTSRSRRSTSGGTTTWPAARRDPRRRRGRGRRERARDAASIPALQRRCFGRSACPFSQVLRRTSTGRHRRRRARPPSRRTRAPPRRDPGPPARLWDPAAPRSVRLRAPEQAPLPPSADGSWDVPRADRRPGHPGQRLPPRSTWPRSARTTSSRSGMLGRAQALRCRRTTPLRSLSRRPPSPRRPGGDGRRGFGRGPGRRRCGRRSSGCSRWAPRAPTPSSTRT